MKTIIYWFSGTGNSLAVATDLAGELNGADLIPIAGIINRPIPEAETLGIVFPVYAFGLPGIVGRFIQRAPVKKAKYIFTVATMGGITGWAHREARELLAAQGARLAAGWSVQMPGNYTVLYGAPPDKKQARMFAKAGQRVKEIAAKISAGATGICEDTRSPLCWLLTPLHKPFISRLPESDSNFVANRNCTHCALCAKVCPVGNIRMAEGSPVWMHHCEQCMACLQWCPVQAIEHGRSTVGKKRYHHPRFKAPDLFLREE